MGYRHPNPAHFKNLRTYSIQEAAKIADVHPNTVRQWVIQGLPVISGYPVLIKGVALKLFLRARRLETKKPCLPHEFYCFKCRTPKTPWGNMADVEKTSHGGLNLRALCPDCERTMNKRVSTTVVEGLSRVLSLTYVTKIPDTS